jgi:hypothetical protein
MQQILLLLFIAEIAYVVVGMDLLRRAVTTRGLPEFFLGLAFVFNGLSYFFTDLPNFLDNDEILNAFSYIGRILASSCALTIAFFNWRVFRAKARWARWIVWADGVLLLVGATVSALEGDWEGAYPLTYTGFWFEWVGGIVPFVWLAVESLRAYSLSRRRVRIGLGNPIVSNRYLLIGLYGTLATLTYPAFLWMYIEYERHGGWSESLGLFTGIIELFSLASLWISFSAPAYYRRWIASADSGSPATRRT